MAKEHSYKGYDEIIKTLTDILAIDKGAEKLQSKYDDLRGLLQKCVDENASVALIKRNTNCSILTW